MSETSYAKAAFFLRPNLVALGVGVLASVVSGSVIVLGIVAGLELFYLRAAASSPRFQRLVRSRGGQL